MSSDMSDLRRQLRLVHDGQLRVVFEGATSTREGAVGGLRVECIPCDDVLAWDPQAGWWLCPSCGYELLPEELLVLLKQLQDGAEKLSSDAKHAIGSGRKWSLGKLLGR